MDQISHLLDEYIIYYCSKDVRLLFFWVHLMVNVIYLIKKLLLICISCSCETKISKSNN